MKKRTGWMFLVCLTLVSVVLASCAKSTPTTMTIQTTTPITTIITKPTTTTTQATTPVTTTGNWWDKFGTPQYGGTIIIRTTTDVASFDPYFTGSNYAGHLIQSLYMEMFGALDWTVDRKIWDFKTRWRPPPYRAGLLAESWEQPDLQTVIMHVRKGVNWQDKPPMNGRELIADDIAYHYNRIFGLGGYGFTKKSPYVTQEMYAPMASVTATDKYTVVFKWKLASLEMLPTLLNEFGPANIEAPEVVKQYGDVNDWRRAVGTGPFILKDFVSGSSVIAIKNPNYWGYDERYPQNRVPYVDEVKFLIIPDDATAFAALRTGKVDLIETLTWQQAQSLGRTNPDIVQVKIPAPGQSLELRVDKAPFTDIRVRKALQMAVDLKTIAQSFYGGYVDSTPAGLFQLAPGYYYPFADWPKELQAEYTYNPAGAKKLLVEAGFPQGFKTNVVTAASYDIDLLEVLKSYFTQIGVDMEIRVMDPVSFTAFTRGGKHDQMVAAASVAYPGEPTVGWSRRYSTHTTNPTFNNDLVYDAMYNKWNTSLDAVERRQLMVDADKYAITQHWAVNILPLSTYNIFQPYFKGYSGEAYLTGFCFARFWVDQSLKKTMGR
jgi:peptide/nickel transport system substrate-binding protein